MLNTSQTPLSVQMTESLVLSDPPSSLKSSSADAHPTSPALDKLKSLLRQTMRISIKDGRIFLGTFAGTDRLLNVLLINTDEFRLPSSPPDASDSRRNATSYDPNPNGRFVGLVLIPWRLVVRAEVHTPYTERDGNVDPDPGVGLRGIVDRYDEAGAELYT